MLNLGIVKIAAAVSTLVLAAGVASAGVEVRVSSERRVDVHAAAVPLSDVLSEMARRTGMKVVYDGPPPRRILTVDFTGRTQADAVVALLEGLGLNYALMLDGKGSQVETLVLITTASSSSSGSPALKPAPPAPPPSDTPTFEEQQAMEEGRMPIPPPREAVPETVAPTMVGPEPEAPPPPAVKDPYNMVRPLALPLRPEASPKPPQP